MVVGTFYRNRDRVLTDLEVHSSTDFANQGEKTVTGLDVLQGLMQRNVSIPARMGWDSWRIHEQMRAEKVALYRRYAEGDHDVRLSQEMKDALRADDGEFALNHCDNIIETLADRLQVNGIRATAKADTGETDETATQSINDWIENLLMWNRFDGFQIGVHTDAVTDGMHYVLAEWDAVGDRVKWSVEPAYDGHSGMIAVYGDNSMTPTMAIKIWHEMQVDRNSKLVDRVRINLYFEDRVEKYIREGAQLMEYVEEGVDWPMAWVNPQTREPLGIAVIPFVYKGRRHNRHGLGRLDDVIPIQQALNRTFVSQIGVAENIGFPIRYLLGASVPSKIRPGTWIQVKLPTKKTLANGTQADLNPTEQQVLMDAISKIRIGQLDAAQLDNLLAQKQDMVRDMYIVSGTPYPEGSSSGISGEALKQLDIRLVGTAQRCQVSFGNSWEDLIKLSARIEMAFGDSSIGFDESRVLLSAEWESAEIRDDAVMVANVRSTVDIIGDGLDLRTKLEMVAPVWGWDKSRIDEIVERVEAAAVGALERELSAFDGFAGLGTGVQLGDPLNEQPLP